MENAQDVENKGKTRTEASITAADAIMTRITMADPAQHIGCKLLDRIRHMARAVG